jgi:hypothetical protein
VLAGAPDARAQPASTPEEAPRPWSVHATVQGQGDADLDRGGEASVQRVQLGLQRRVRLHEGTALEFGLRYERDDWDIDRAYAFQGIAPWETLESATFGLGLMHRLDDRWSLAVNGQVGLAREPGAELRQSRQAGLSVTLAHAFSADLTLGLGLSVVREIGETRLRPLPLVNWQLHEHWRLANGTPLSPIGPASLELRHERSPAWHAAVGVGAAQRRYRLDADGPSAGGIAETGGTPLYARFGWRLAPGVQLGVHGGMSLGGRLRLEDAQGHLVAEDDLDRAPFVGFSLLTRF